MSWHHGCVCVVCSNYSVCHLLYPTSLLGNIRVFLHLWDAFQNWHLVQSFLLPLSGSMGTSVEAAPLVSWCWRKLVRTPGFFLFSTQRERHEGCGLSRDHLKLMATFQQVCWEDICLELFFQGWEWSQKYFISFIPLFNMI